MEADRHVFRRGYYGNEYEGKIIINETWIDIDAGAASGFDPVLLRLDDMKQFSAVIK